MRSLRRVLWASALSALSAGGALAQTTTTTGSTTSTTASTGGATGSTTGGTASGQGGTSGLNTNMASSSLQAPTITAPSDLNTTTAALATSNAFNKYYANPYYQGRAGVSTGAASSSTANNPGGFGVALYGTGTGTSGTNSGAASTGGRNTSGGTSASTTGFGSTTGTAGTTQARSGSTSGFGGTSGPGTTGGFGGATTGATGGRQGQIGGLNGGANSGLNQQNNGLSTGRSIAYTATLKFAAPPVAAPQMLTDLRTILDSSASIADSKTVSVITEAGGIVTLKGTARDEDEARLIEGMIRLTPGVKAVNNGLTFPK